MKTSDNGGEQITLNEMAPDISMISDQEYYNKIKNEIHCKICKNLLQDRSSNVH